MNPSFQFTEDYPQNTGHIIFFPDADDPIPPCVILRRKDEKHYIKWWNNILREKWFSPEPDGVIRIAFQARTEERAENFLRLLRDRMMIRYDIAIFHRVIYKNHIPGQRNVAIYGGWLQSRADEALKALVEEWGSQIE